MTTPTHSKECAYHLDQYSWECDCGSVEKFEEAKTERVAKAVYESYRESVGRSCGDMPWMLTPEHVKAVARAQARAAIEALK